MITPQLQTPTLSSANVESVIPVSARSVWTAGTVLAGTVGGVAAAADVLTAGALFAAHLADATPKSIVVPLGCTYMEIGAWGDNAAIGTSPVVEFWRSHGTGTGQGIVPDNWSLLRNVLGATPVTLSGTINDATGAAGATRYSMDEGTYQQFLFDVRGARVVVPRLTTIGTTGNWSLFYRFI